MSLKLVFCCFRAEPKRINTQVIKKWPQKVENSDDLYKKKVLFIKFS